VKNRLNKYPFVPPILVGLFFVLSLLSRNVDEVVVSQAFLPALITTGLILCFYLALRYGLKSREKAGFVSLLVVIVFFSYGYLQSSFDKILFGAVVIGVVIVVSAAYRKFKFFTAIASIISICLIIPVSVPVIAYYLNIGIVANGSHNIETNWEGIQEKPDIYYIIMDRYASAEVYESLGYDNRGFINYLEDKGFYVVPNGHSNYCKTSLSLASSLNMDYIDTQALTNTLAIWRFMEDNAVKGFLQTGDYTFINVGSFAMNQTNYNRYADINYRYKGNVFTSDFFQELYKSTIASFAKAPVRYARECYRDTILYQFETLETIPLMGEPTFTFAHILCPHGPWVFNPDGSYPAENEVNERSRIENNFNQVLYANERLEQLINKILNESVTPPIIIIQGDEGVYTDEYNQGPISENEGYRQRLGILNAYYLPHEGGNALYESITPVNTFRVVFNEYFGANLELLPDKSHFITFLRYPLVSIDVTDELQED